MERASASSAVVDSPALGVDDVVAPGEVLSGPQRSLLEQGPLPYLTKCVAQPKAEGTSTSAAVGCDATFPGVDAILLRQSQAGAALTSYMDNPNRPRGDCAVDVKVDGTWAQGPLACYDNNTGLAALWWGYGDSGVNLVAVRNDGKNDELYDWFVQTDWSSRAGPPA